MDVAGQDARGLGGAVDLGLAHPLAERLAVDTQIRRDVGDRAARGRPRAPPAPSTHRGTSGGLAWGWILLLPARAGQVPEPPEFPGWLSTAALPRPPQRDAPHTIWSPSQRPQANGIAELLTRPWRASGAARSSTAPTATARGRGDTGSASSASRGSAAPSAVRARSGAFEPMRAGHSAGRPVRESNQRLRRGRPGAGRVRGSSCGERAAAVEIAR